MPATKRPNVLIFFTDQQRHDTTGLHGCPLDLTPNLDRVGRAGTHLSHLFTCQPVCGPARSCLQTGQYATTTGVWKNGFGLKDDAVTLADTFREAGYRTGYFGKWHLAPSGGSDGPVEPRHRGGYRDWLASNALEHTSDAYRTRLWDSDGDPHDLPGYRVDAVADALIRYVDDRHDGDQPFFAMASFIEPHHQNHRDDYPAPEGYAERYHGRWTPPDLAALPAWSFDPAGAGEASAGDRGTLGGSAQRHLGGYCGMIKRLDEAFGRVMDTLHSLGIADDTVVLFTSDHGCHFKTRNGEYKRSCHDASIRVPGVLTGGPFTGGGRVDGLVSLVDLPATLLDAAGINVPDTMQGRSVLPLVRRQAADWKEEVFVQISESQTGRAVRTGRWKYSVEAPEGAADGGRSDLYKEAFLYDLEADPYELVNRINNEAFRPVADVMRARLVRRMVEAGEDEPRIEEQAATQGPGQFHVTEAEARS